jgi:uncharacterized membrane protein YwaF
MFVSSNELLILRSLKHLNHAWTWFDVLYSTDTAISFISIIVGDMSNKNTGCGSIDHKHS